MIRGCSPAANGFRPFRYATDNPAAAAICQLDDTNTNMRNAAAFLKAIVTANGEGLRTLTTYSDLGLLLTHLAALTIDAISQPAALPTSYINQSSIGWTSDDSPAVT